MKTKLLGALSMVLILPAAALLFAIALNRPMLLEPPGFAKRLLIYFRHHTAETAADPLLPELRIRRYRLPEERMRRAVEQTLRSLPRWRMIRVEEEYGAYQVEVISPVWRFRDDMTILVSRSESGESEVYLHSASRVGRGDLGANRAHILQFYEALDRRLRENS